MMDYRRSSLVMNRQQQVTSNQHIYASFAGTGPPRHVNGILPENSTMWWDEERIEATVTRQFVMSKLRPDEQVRLDEPLGFGDGLTDDTYMEWIAQKAKRIFLILVELGVPDQIFGVIDDSWDDDDLPVPLDQVERLQLTYDKDEKLEKKFFQRQFNYLLKNIQKGEHLIYDDDEVVSLELAEKRPVGAVTGLAYPSVDKVHLPGRPDDLLLRRRLPLGTAPGCMPQEEFLSGIEAMKAIEHDHLMSLWASYVHEGVGYLLLTPVNEGTLKSFLAVTPQSIKILAKQDRRILLINWIHCLADALKFLHSHGLAHRNIKPSNVMFNLDNHIFLGDSGIFPTTGPNGEKKGFDKEMYDYCAPEQAPHKVSAHPTHIDTLRPNSSRSGPPPPPRRTSSTTTHTSIHSLSQTISSVSNETSSIHTSSTGSNESSGNGNTNSSSSASRHPHRSSRAFASHDPQKADIFSLGTIFLEILTFLMKRTSRNFQSHRSSKNKTPGRGGGLPDASFHKNLNQVESWMNTLAKDASKKEDKIFRGVSHIIALVARMLSVDPSQRPSASEVQERLYTILSENSGLGQPPGEKRYSNSESKIHCEPHEEEETEWNFGFDQLRLASQRAAAEACASVNPVTANGGTIGLTAGVIYGVERACAVGSPALNGTMGTPGSISQVYSRERAFSRDGDRASIATSNKSKSSEGKSKFGGTGPPQGKLKPKAKAKAWQAPVYAGGLAHFFKQKLQMGGF